MRKPLVHGLLGSAVDVAIPAGRTLAVVRETARLLRLNDSAPPMRLAFWLPRPQVRAGRR